MVFQNKSYQVNFPGEHHPRSIIFTQLVKQALKEIEECFFQKHDGRQERRLNKKIPLFYKISHLDMDWEHTRTLDISDNGACILASHPVEIGDEILLDIILPNSNDIVSVTGDVVWKKLVSFSLNEFKYGISFKNKKLKFSRANDLLWNIADRHCQLLNNHTKDCVGHPVQNAYQLKSAFRLLYTEYSARKICEPNEAGMHYHFYSLLPVTQTFLLRKDEDFLGTLGLISDSPAGLPMESIFPEEINHLRKQGRRLAEVGSLALNSHYLKRNHYSLKNFQKQACLFKLFKTMFDYARVIAQSTDLIIGVHPKHQNLYHFLNFETAGPVRSYQGACGKPAVLMRLDIETLVRNYLLLKKGPGTYFLKDINSLELLKKPFTCPSNLVEDFLFGTRPVWHTFSEDQKEHMKKYYPSLIKHETMELSKK